MLIQSCCYRHFAENKRTRQNNITFQVPATKFAENSVNLSSTAGAPRVHLKDTYSTCALQGLTAEKRK